MLPNGPQRYLCECSSFPGLKILIFHDVANSLILLTKSWEESKDEAREM